MDPFEKWLAALPDYLKREWEVHYKALQAFYDREGHSRVPADHVENGLNLGSWVRTQNGSRESLSEVQINRLEALGVSCEIRIYR
jgi:hypothetical protein